MCMTANELTKIRENFDRLSKLPEFKVVFEDYLFKTRIHDLTLQGMGDIDGSESRQLTTAILSSIAYLHREFRMLATHTNKE